jgi:hypothetical protein
MADQYMWENRPGEDPDLSDSHWKPEDFFSLGIDTIRPSLHVEDDRAVFIKGFRT